MENIVLLDTNFIMLPAQCGVDVFVELKMLFPANHIFAVLDRTVEELTKIAKSSKKDSFAAKTALKLIKAKHLKIVPAPSDKYADDALKAYAEQGAVIATQDRGIILWLQKRKLQNVRLLRRKRRLSLHPK